MLPSQGQGAGMAVEDSGALGVCFRGMPEAPSAAVIEERLTLFERVRMKRASVVQLLSSVPYFENGFEIILPRLLGYMSREQPPRTGHPRDVRPWLFRYDVMERKQESTGRALTD